MSTPREQAAALVLAVQFLSRLPVGTPVAYSTARARATPRYYALAGALLGAIAALVYTAAAAALPHAVSVTLGVAALILATGALHEDGFADCCDGLGGARTPEQALAIMRDSRIGTYGALGLVVLLALKLTALTHLPGAWLPVVLVAAHTLSRAAIVIVMLSTGYVRDAGAASDVAGGGTFTNAGLAALTGAVMLVPLAAVAGNLAVLAALAGAAFGATAMRALFVRRLGGYTGDCLGAVQQLAELGVYLGVLTVAGAGAAFG